MTSSSYQTALSFAITFCEQSYWQFNWVHIAIPVRRHVLSVHVQIGPYLNMGASSQIGILHDLRSGLGL